jgi:hypothetical protein
MSLKAVIELIRKEFEIESKNFQDVVDEALSYLSKSIQAEARLLVSVKDQAFFIASSAGLIASAKP